jgi:hypothetical protein
MQEFKVRRENGKIDIKIRYECDICKLQIETFKSNLKGREGLICKPCRNKLNGKLKTGKPSPRKGKPSFLKGAAHPKWNGGKYIASDGYVMVLVKHGSLDRKSGWENYRKEHVVLMEKKIGRKLKKGECVHHIDGDKQNNNLSNLFLMDNKSHKEAHQSLQEIGYSLFKRGILKFDRKTGKYKEAQNDNK